MWYACRFEPLDLLAGADARALDDGGWGHDGAIAPDAFSGAIRTRLLANNGFVFGKQGKCQSTAADVGKISPFDAGARLGVPLDAESEPAVDTNVMIAAPLSWSVRRNRLLWPAPRSHLWNDQNAQWKILRPHHKTKNPDILADKGLRGLHILECDDRDATVFEGYLDTKNICRVLGEANGRPVEKSCKSDIWVPERRYGHERGESGVVREAKLFSRANMRFTEAFVIGQWESHAPAALAAGIEDFITIPFEGLVRLGGDSRLARLRIEPLADDVRKPMLELKQMVMVSLKKDSIVRLYLGTPAIFDQEGDGWRPRFGTGEGVKLMAAAVGRPQVIGGWDLAKKRPKHPKRAVPAGAVYYYQVQDAEMAKTFVEKYHFGASICEQHGHLGYGLALFGVWS